MEHFMLTKPTDSKRAISSEPNILLEKVNIINSFKAIDKLKGDENGDIEGPNTPMFSCVSSSNERIPFYQYNLPSSTNFNTSRTRANTEQNKFSISTICEENRTNADIEPETPCPFKRSGLLSKKRLHHNYSETVVQEIEQPRNLA